jgi:cysteine synthase B
MTQASRKIIPISNGLGQSLLQRIGNTPLLRFRRITPYSAGVEVLAKAEWANPGGSVKDRTAASIVADALRTGKLGFGTSLLDSTSGNTGIAYAMLGAVEGFPVTLCIPGNVSAERARIIRCYGANIIFTDAGEGSDGALRKARELAVAEPQKYFYADQYSNDANWRAHYRGTAEELWRQTKGGITHFVAMLGTSGTFIGTTRRLKELNRNICCISLQPDSPFHGIEGAKHMPSSIVPRIYDPTLADDNLFISTEESYTMMKRLAREEGMLVGISAAGAMVGSLRVAERVERGSVVVTICPDGADRYLSERLWEEG